MVKAKKDRQKESIQSGYNQLNELFQKHGYRDYKWIDPQKIIVAQWVRMKCTYGCGGYGQSGCCPPNVPTVAECERFFGEYENAVIFRFEKKLNDPEDRHKWSQKVNTKLVKLEREVFVGGYEKAFLFFMDSCHMCAECTGTREDCKNLMMSRPSPEAFGVHVYATVRQFGFPIQFLSDYTQKMNRYAFLLIE